MITASQTETSPYASYLREAHKARRARFEAAARKVANRNDRQPVLICGPKRYILRIEHTHDYHVRLWRAWKADQVSVIKNYINQRCEELGVDPEKIRGGSREKDVIKAKDAIVFEIKTRVKPDAKWSEIARHFGMDHSSVITVCRRGAAAAGDAEALQRLERIREEQLRRYQAEKARPE